MRRRESFDAVAESYDLARPPYPAALLADLQQICRLGPGSRVLEVGAGSGQLTVPLAGTGAEIVAVELGPNLAAIAARRLAEYENVRVIVADFDTWTPSDPSFGLVVAATSFHWLDRAARVPKCAEALGPRGKLAVIQTRWGVGGVGGTFARASQDCYERWDPDHDPGFRAPALEDLPERLDELADSGLFRTVEHRRYPEQRRYSAAAYVDLLGSFSNVLGLDDEHRHGLLGCMRRLIQNDFNGHVTRLDVFDMWIAELC